MRSTLVLLVASVTLAACSSQSMSSAPPTNTSGSRLVRGSITLRIVNATGNSYNIHASPNLNPPIPQPVGGLITLGTAEPGTSCILLPAEFDEFVTSASTGHTDTLRWMSSASLSIVAYNTSSSVVTSEFVPNDATGWSITLPAAGSPPSVSQDSPCIP